MKKFFSIVLYLLNLVVGLALIASMVLTQLDAQSFPRVVIFAMTFPAWLIIAFVLLIVDFYAWRRGCLWIAFSVALSLPLALTVLPLNFTRGQLPSELEDSSWTLLTYNVYGLTDITQKYANDLNPAVSFVLNRDADVVVLEEAEWLMPLKLMHITTEQMDSLKERYPYRFLRRDVILLSKFPADTLSIDEFPEEYYHGNVSASRIGAYVLDIHGHKVALFGCHLQSLGLTDEDKSLYKDLTKGEGLTSKQELKDVKNDIIYKIGKANAARALQSKAFVRAIREADIPSTIVCGDFNDTPGCYTLTELGRIGLREVYPLVGCGYMNTYNSDRLLFQIDHVLFRGVYRPWSMQRPKILTSDHYPLVTTFVLDRN